MRGYKIFDSNWQCRGLQYTVGKTAMSGPPELCKRGLHFCARAIDCLNYYSLLPSNRYAEVRAEGHIVPSTGNQNENLPVGQILSNKYATNALTVVREIPFEEFRDMCTGVVTNTTDVLTVRTTMVKGLKEGVETSWIGNTKILKQMFAGGQLNGPYTQWTTGQVCEQGSYENGVREGICTIYHPNGVINYKGNYSGGWLDGVHTEYSATGKKLVERTYKHNILHGTLKRFYRNCCYEEYYENGFCQWRNKCRY